MKQFCLLFSAILISLIFTIPSHAQLDFDRYKKFMEQNKDLTADGLYSLYPVGTFKKHVPKMDNVLYLDSMQTKLELTKFELEQINNYGFVITERFKPTNYQNDRGSFQSFWDFYKYTYIKDLPVFISTDAILHSIHMSYDAILKDFEESIIIPKFNDFLVNIYNKIPDLKTKYKDYSGLNNSINDLDVYFTVARRLNEDSKISANFPVNNSFIDTVMNLIDGLQPSLINLFSKNPKMIDFSQLTPRGHYTENRELTNYFKSMMWFGRTEFYLTLPGSGNDNATPDIQRQIIDAALINELMQNSTLDSTYYLIDKIIKSFVGSSDNVQLKNIDELLNDVHITSISQLLDLKKIKEFQDTLATKPFAEQRIVSQILGPGGPAKSFLLYGQKFIIDSYITSNVVYDRVPQEDPPRLMPSSNDVLFALGNNSAADFLRLGLDEYKYAPNLAGLRYLTDSTSLDFWNSSIYNHWLNSIRKLAPPSDSARAKLPEFMKTASWWQEKMNTQLASWSQLRHDNLLYAKQSYTAVCTCSHPFAYLEPATELYSSLINLADKIENDLLQFDLYQYSKRHTYTANLKDVATKLKTISEKEILGVAIDSTENNFLRSIFQTYTTNSCGGDIENLSGWFAELFYNEPEDADKRDFIVADVHTDPNSTGVLHVGTGPPNMAIVTAKSINGNMMAFAGPVMSYYEYISLNYKRLTDEEWLAGIADGSLQIFRPGFTDLYLADVNGNQKNAAPISLPVGVEEINNENLHNVTTRCFPNPFTESTIIAFVLNSEANQKVSIGIYDLSGELVNSVFEGTLAKGNYAVRWDATEATGSKVAKGMYLYRVIIDGKSYSDKIVVQ